MCNSPKCFSVMYFPLHLIILIFEVPFPHTIIWESACVCQVTNMITEEFTYSLRENICETKNLKLSLSPGFHLISCYLQGKRRPLLFLTCNYSMPKQIIFRFWAVFPYIFKTAGKKLWVVQSASVLLDKVNFSVWSALLGDITVHSYN